MINSLSFRKIALLIFISFIVWSSKDMFMLNQGDFHRAIYPFLGDIEGIHFRGVIPLSYQLKDNFLPIYSYEYKSSYSLLLYIYAATISAITDTFDIQLLSALIKIFYVLSLYFLFLKISNNSNVIVFIISCIPLLSSSNLSYFSSFYQEQILLPLLPICLSLVGSLKSKDEIIVFLCVSIIACSKSQFFYIPFIFAMYYIIFDREKLATRLSLMGFSLLLSIMCIAFSTGASHFNKYHSNFFGVYQYMKLENVKIPNYIDEKCVGVDSWGNRYDIKNGAVWTDIGESCLWENTSYGFENTIKEIINNPSMLIKLPYSKSMETFYGEDYFHVYKQIKLIKNDNNFSSVITKVKDALFNKLRFSILIACIIISIIFFRNKIAGVFFILGTIGVSQLYVSFLGEGYRDINKHLSSMNYSFDLVLFLIMVLLITNAMKIIYKKAGR